ncbi:MAG: cheB 1 [Flavipsychrobacter sp.]|nr:cheB 1 [Flavipsychrobacter sp.]
MKTKYSKVLIIDDTFLDRLFMEKVIKAYDFADQTVSYDSAAGALDYLNSVASQPGEFPEVILLDIQMPDMDGFDFMDKYIELPKEVRSGCYVVMLSSSVAVEDLLRVETYEEIRRFFNKPLNAGHLIDLTHLPDELSS